MALTTVDLFTPFVMLVSLLFAGFIFLRKPRVEWVALVGGVFASNFANQLCDVLLNTFDAGPWAYGAQKVFDRATIFLLFWLALAYPRQPRFVRGRPVLFTAILGSLFAVYLVTYMLAKQTYSSLDPFAAMPWYGVAFEYLFPSLPFLIIVVRWTRAFLREESPLIRHQNQFMLAAFGTRAIHVLVTYPLLTATNFSRGDLQVGGLHTIFAYAFHAVEALKLAAVAAVFIFLLVARVRKPTDQRRAIDFVLAFFLVGLAEALVLDPGLPFPVLVSTLSALDVVIIRPLLIWYAMARYQLLGPNVPARSVGLSLLIILGFASFLSGSYAVLQGRSVGFGLGASVAIALLLTAVLAIILDPVLRRNLARPDAAQRVEVYVSAVEDAYRNRSYATDQRRLDGLRQALGLSEEQAEALDEAVRTRWSTQARATWRPGDRILGRYEVRKLLAEGGSGQAYLADDVLTQQPVVLKRTRSLDATAHRALLQESYALARLDHPNVVRLVRTEVVADEPILVLEYLEGGTLASRLAEQGPLDPAEALAITRQVLAGLEAAHRHGIIHRDLKPANVLFDAHGQAKVSDFGLARRWSNAPSLGNPTESSPSPAGTVRYMAPEQVQGLPASAASDVYAAALLYYECLAGRAHVPAGLSDFATRRLIVEGPAALPDPSWPVAVRTVLDRALQRDPAHRFASAAEFAEALSSIGPEQQLAAADANDIPRAKGFLSATRQ